MFSCVGCLERSVADLTEGGRDGEAQEHDRQFEGGEVQNIDHPCGGRLDAGTRDGLREAGPRDKPTSSKATQQTGPAEAYMSDITDRRAAISQAREVQGKRRRRALARCRPEDEGHDRGQARAGQIAAIDASLLQPCVATV